MRFAQKAQKLAAAIVGLTLWLAPPCVASGLEVAPVTLDLPAQGGAGSLYLVNRGTDPLAVQVEAFAWVQTAEGEQLAPSNAIALSPPLAQLAPGQKQTVRLLVKPDPAAAGERAFRVLVTELPPPTRTDAVRMLLQLSIPVFASNAASRARVDWTADRKPDGMWIVARNTGSKRAKLRELEFIADGAKGRAQPASRLTYILAGATRTFKVAGIGAAQTVDIRALDQHNKLSTLASVVLPR
jgi:fimbrial chaperone protein